MYYSSARLKNVKVRSGTRKPSVKIIPKSRVRKYDRYIDVWHWIKYGKKRTTDKSRYEKQQEKKRLRKAKYHARTKPRPKTRPKTRPKQRPKPRRAKDPMLARLGLTVHSRNQRYGLKRQRFHVPNIGAFRE